MTDATFERRLRDWLESREPGAVPPSLREAAAGVSLETPIPLGVRVREAVLGAGRAGRRGTPIRLVLVLVLLGLLVAAAAVALTTGGAQPPAPLTAWRDYVVGRPAPDLEFVSVAGPLTNGDDPTISVDDLTQYGFVVALYFPGNASTERTAADTRALAQAADHAPATTGFMVIAPPSAPIAAETVDSLHAAGITTAEPPAGWQAAGQADGEPVLVIANRRGIVEYVYVGDLPTADWLVGDLDRASVP